MNLNEHKSEFNPQEFMLMKRMLNDVASGGQTAKRLTPEGGEPITSGDITIDQGLSDCNELLLRIYGGSSGAAVNVGIAVKNGETSVLGGNMAGIIRNDSRGGTGWLHIHRISDTIYHLDFSAAAGDTKYIFAGGNPSTGHFDGLFDKIILSAAFPEGSYYDLYVK